MTALCPMGSRPSAPKIPPTVAACQTVVPLCVGWTPHLEIVSDPEPIGPQGTGWAPHDADILESELARLAFAIQGRIDAARGSAAAAHDQLEALRTHASITECVDDEEHGRVIVRLSALAEEVSKAEAATVAALEAELVSVDDTLEKLQSGSANQRDLRAQFGPGPLHPVAPCELALVASESRAEMMTLVAPRAISGLFFHVKRLAVPATWGVVPDFCILALNRQGLHILTLEHACVASFALGYIRHWYYSELMVCFDYCDAFSAGCTADLEKASFDTCQGRAIVSAFTEAVMAAEVRRVLKSCLFCGLP